MSNIHRERHNRLLHVGTKKHEMILLINSQKYLPKCIVFTHMSETNENDEL